MLIFYVICTVLFVIGVLTVERNDLKTEPRELALRFGLWLSGTSASCTIIFTVMFVYFKLKGAI